MSRRWWWRRRWRGLWQGRRRARCSDKRGAVDHRSRFSRDHWRASRWVDDSPLTERHDATNVEVVVAAGGRQARRVIEVGIEAALLGVGRHGLRLAHFEANQFPARDLDGLDALMVIVIVGEPPVMDARLVRRVSESEWSTESLLETSVRPLTGAHRPESFSF